MASVLLFTKPLLKGIDALVQPVDGRVWALETIPISCHYKLPILIM